METLAETEWDVLISGTGLPQSLLALALSRSGKRVLHVDRNGYYGGPDAALSLEDAEDWVKAANEGATGALAHPRTDGAEPPTIPYSQTQSRSRNSIQEKFKTSHISIPPKDDSISDPQPVTTKIGFSRSYSLALSPQLIYTRSALLPTLVSSKVYRQLEFLAVGSWWIYELNQDSESNTPTSTSREKAGTLKKIPGGREDVFADKTIDLKSKRSLMRFLRLAADNEALQPVLEQWGERSFQDYLTLQIGISKELQSALHALTLSLEPPSRTKTSYALPRITRHLKSIGVFGPGFGSVIPKWGGIAEIAQVACRACAVGGGVYVLNKVVEGYGNTSGGSKDASLKVQLQNGDSIRTKWITGCQDDFPPSKEATDQHTGSYITRSIYIVSSCLSQLFPLSAEGSPPPAAAVIAFPEGTVVDGTPPVYFMVHSSETGECPAGQCVIYATTLLSGPAGFELLDLALKRLGSVSKDEARPTILWSLRYSQYHNSLGASKFKENVTSNGVITFPEPSVDLAFDDDVLEAVKKAWTSVTGETSGFMQFEDRETGAYDDEDP